MTLLPSATLSYWASCLAEEMRLTPPTDAGDAAEVAFLSAAEILSGCVPRGVVEHLATAGREPKQKAGQPPGLPTEVMVAPWVIQKDDPGSRHATAAPQALYWLHATLAEDGSLTPDANVLPLLNRDLLAPSRNVHLVIGELQAWEHARRQKERWKETWDDFVAEMQDEFKALSGHPIADWLPDGYRKAEGIVRRVDVLPVKSSVRRIHDACRIYADAPPPLLARMLSDVPPALDAASFEGRRLGHLGGTFVPNAEQARAIDAAAALPENGVLAVSGPPGTGKTAYLQGVVADEVVRAFLKGGPPPMILLTSINNQAVDNAVEALSPAPDRIPIERGRWIEGIAGYGCRWASGDRAKEEHQQLDAVARTLFATDTSQARLDFWLAGYHAWSRSSGSSVAQAVADLRRACAGTAGEARRLAVALQDLRCLLGRGGLPALDRRLARLERIRQRREGKLAAAAESVSRAAEAFEGEKARCASMDAAAREALANGGLVDRLLGFLPAVKRAAWQRVAAAIRRAGMELPAEAAALDADGLLAAHIQRLSARTAAWRKAHMAPFNALKLSAEQRAAKAADCCRRLQETRRRIVDAAGSAAGCLGLTADPPEIDQALIDRAAKHLDLELRRRAFDLAMRAREGEFVLAAANGEHHPAWADMRGRQNREAREKLFRAFCSVVPCIASTIYVAANRFDCFEDGRPSPLTSFLDLLILDEAGQVPPHRGLPLLGLARRAVVVGDVHQLKPIVTLDEGLCERLAQHGGLSENDLADQDRRGLRVHGGSVMSAALAASYAADPGSGDRGILLRRHFRCAKSIISYCNDLAYGGRLIPCIADDTNPPFPHLGHAHVRSLAQRAGTSRRNEIEAAAIARWIGDNEAAILKAYGSGEADTIGKVLAIITPFAAQRNELRAAVGKLLGERANGITIDTVHALQGAERQMVIFSPTVTAEPGSAPPFFARDSSLMNVAVSRAKKSFIVIGDMRLFDQARHTPLGLLGRHLHAAETNELVGVNPFALEPEVQRLVNAAEHDAFLARTMAKARKRVIIRSFGAWAKSIADAGLDRLTSGCADRDVRVHFLIAEPPRHRGSLNSALGLLDRAGGTVFTAERMHTKTLVIDDDIILEGSFNWCGAYRDRQASEERSFAISGYRARAYVEQALSELRSLKMTRFAPEPARRHA